MNPQIIDGYTVVDLLGVGGRGTVYKVLHPQTRQPLALKVLRTAELLPLEEQRFVREFKVASSIVHPNVVQVFHVGRHEGSPYYTMELVEGTNLRVHMGDHRPEVPGPERRRWFEELAQITDQVLLALGCIHGQKIIHRDLKPENILVAAGPQAKLVDFGLAKMLQANQRLTAKGDVVGTPQYMSPEALLKQEVDSRTDLYALGVILYEIISGKPLFDNSEALGALAQILYQEPTPLRLFCPDVPLELEAAIMRLLRKDPHDRYATAREVQLELASAFRRVAVPVQGSPVPAGVGGGYAPPGPPPVAPAENQTSEVFEPRMVGRSAQLEVLGRAFEDTRAGNVRLVVIHGESGIGKSRLLNEFVRRASHKGIPAMWSRCYENDATPFRAVTPWLRHLARTAEAALGPLAPESVTTLFGSGASENPADRFRLFEMASRQVRAALESGPAMLVVEDLQWADAYSMEMLEYLVGTLTHDTVAPGHGVLLLATVREEEAHLNQPMVQWFKSLSGRGWHVDLPINRLTEQDVNEMIRSMLGTQEVVAGLTDIVYRETEGNPFFIGELLKSLVAHGALVKEADRWVLHDPERHRILSPGAVVQAGILPPTVQEAIRARIRRLPVSHREILSHAAVMGQVFSFEQVTASTGTDPVLMVEAVEMLLDQRFIAEVPQSSNSQFAFYHNKIREVLLGAMSAEQVRDIHLKVGVALEAYEKTRPSASGLFTLAFHFASSGIWYRAKPYLLAAAEQATRSFAYLQAADYYRQLLEANQSDRVLEADEVVKLKEARADALDAGGQHAEAARLFEELIGETRGELALARMERKLARVHYNAGDYEAALHHLDAGLKAMGISVPKRGVASYVRMAENFLRSTNSALVNKSYVHDARRAREILELCDGIFHAVYFMDAGRHFSLLVNAILIYKQVAVQVKEDADLATSEFLIAYFFCIQNPPKARKAHHSLQKTLDVLHRMPDDSRKATLLRECGSLYYMLGWFNEALLFASQGRELSSQIADVTGLAWGCITESNVHWWQGNLESARQLSSQAIQLSSTTGMRSAWVVATVLLARQMLTAGEAQEAARLLDEVRQYAPGGTHRYEDLMSDLGYGMLRHRQGRLSEAVALLRQAMEGLLAAHCGTTYVLEAGAELADTYYTQATGGRRNSAAVNDMEKLVRRLDKLAQDLPVRRGAILRLQGQVAGLRGQDKDAMTFFQESQKVLETGGYYLDLALTFEATGNYLDRQSPGDGHAYLKRAADLFTTIGAPHRSPLAQAADF